MAGRRPSRRAVGVAEVAPARLILTMPGDQVAKDCYERYLREREAGAWVIVETDDRPLDLTSNGVRCYVPPRTVARCPEEFRNTYLSHRFLTQPQGLPLWREGRERCMLCGRVAIECDCILE
jgi:hypothetical protein